ncbi:putative penicillin-insensitive murein endopeptidase [Actinobacillus pleuropneumoniae]|nr:putative penicillin-insensitive murein endopeptidase [Actinobacillus pleuropneumoniae]
MKRFKMLLLSSFLGLVTSAHATVWEQIRTPVAGQAQPIGGYSNGCIIGAQPLALKGDGYQVIRSARNRFYGHPDLLSFLQRLAKNTKAAAYRQS